MSKITLNSLANLQNETTAVGIINTNSTTIQTAMDNTLSRDGTAPNQMAANIDMNSNRILNLPSASTANEPLRLADITAFQSGSATFSTMPTGGATNAVLAKNSASNYDVSWTLTPTHTTVTTTGAAAVGTALTVGTTTTASGQVTVNTAGIPAVLNSTNSQQSLQLKLAGANVSFLGATAANPLYVQNAINNNALLVLDDTTGGTIANQLSTHAVATTNPIILEATGTDANIDLRLKSKGTGGFGYATGLGGTVTQITSRTTTVVLNKICGNITLFNVAPTLAAWVTFTVTNSTVAQNDVVIVSIRSGTNTYIANVSAVAAGSFNITFSSILGTAADSPIINFTVIKSVIS